MRKFALIVLAICFVLPLKLLAIDEVIDQLPGFVEEGMSAWHVPGMAVAVLSDEKVLFQQGFGKTSVNGGKQVDIHTQFAIASTTKAMVAVGIMMLADEKKLTLDDLAIQHIPELQFGETWLNSQITVRDLLTHRTGLGSTDFWAFFQGTPLEEQISLLKSVEPSASLRSRFQYQNTMFELLGEIIERLSGKPWNDFVNDRLWQPLGMNETYASRGRIDKHKDQVLPYQYLNDKLSQARWNLDPDLADAAGSVWSSVSDMGRWAQFLLRGGVTEKDQRLISEESFAELFKPQMLIALADFYPTTKITKPRWTTYGLGWFQQDFQGRKIDFHTGSLSGLIAMVGLDRENKRAVVILGNRDHAEMRHAILWQVMDHQPVASRSDWNAEILALYGDRKKNKEQKWQKTVDERLSDTSTSLPIENYTGTYRHAAYGDLKVVQTENGMILKGGKVQLELSHWHLDTFLTELNGEDWKFLLPFNVGSKAEVQSMDLFEQVFVKVKEIP